MKRDYSISKQMQDDLIKAYNEVAKHCWHQMEAYRKTVKQPAPRYYVSPRRAADVLAPMLRGDFSRVNKMHPNRRRLYYSLYDVVSKMSEERGFVGKPLSYVMQFAVLRPAPEFFLSASQFQDMRLWIKRGMIRDDGSYTPLPHLVRSYERLKKKRARAKARREALEKRSLEA